MLVMPNGTLDDPIMFGLHWPLLTDKFPEYPTVSNMMYNPCINDWLRGLEGDKMLCLSTIDLLLCESRNNKLSTDPNAICPPEC